MSKAIVVKLQQPTAADQLADVRAAISALKKKEEAIVAEIKARFDANPENLVFEGETVDAVGVFQIRETLDMERVRGYLSPQQLTAAKVVKNVLSIKVRGKKKEG